MLSSGSPLTWSLPRFFFFLRFYMYFINVKYKIGEYNKGVNQEFFHTTSACQKHSGQSYVPKWECWCVYVCKMFSQSNVYSIPLQKKPKHIHEILLSCCCIPRFVDDSDWNSRPEGLSCGFSLSCVRQLTPMCWWECESFSQSVLSFPFRVGF